MGCIFICTCAHTCVLHMLVMRACERACIYLCVLVSTCNCTHVQLPYTCVHRSSYIHIYVCAHTCMYAAHTCVVLLKIINIKILF